MHSFTKVMYFIFFYFSIFSFHSFYFPFPIKEISIIRLLTTSRRGNKRFDVHLWQIRTVHFLSKDGKARPMMEEMDGRVGYFPPESAFLTLMY